LRLPKHGLDFLSLVGRGPERRSRITGKSTRLIGEITRIAKITEIVNSNPRIRKRRGIFCRPDNVDKWYEIHRTSGHDLEECKTFLDHKKMLLPAVPVT
jgi:hypothetical protein